MSRACMLAALLASLLAWTGGAAANAQPAIPHQDTLAINGPEMSLAPMPADQVLYSGNGMVEAVGNYRGHHGVAGSDPCCGEHFGGFGPLWGNYCFEKRSCGWHRGCGVACGSNACCPPGRKSCTSCFRATRCRRPATCAAGGKCKTATPDCNCGMSETSTSETGPTGIGDPPEPQPTPVPPDPGSAGASPAEGVDIQSPENRSARRRWLRH